MTCQQQQQVPSDLCFCTFSYKSIININPHQQQPKVVFITDMLREKVKADIVDDEKGTFLFPRAPVPFHGLSLFIENERDTILEYVAEFLEFKYGASSPRVLKSFVQTLQKNLMKQKEEQSSIQILFARLCGVVDPPCPENALDYMNHELLEQIWKMRSNSGPLGDKRKFPGISSYYKTNFSR
jgi:hypothetical protein